MNNDEKIRYKARLHEGMDSNSEFSKEIAEWSYFIDLKMAAMLEQIKALDELQLHTHECLLDHAKRLDKLES